MQLRKFAALLLTMRLITALIAAAVLATTGAWAGSDNPNFPPIVTTPNSSNLVPGFSIVSGYTEDIANGSTLLTWGQQMFWKFISSSGTSTETVLVSASIDNPAPVNVGIE